MAVQRRAFRDAVYPKVSPLSIRGCVTRYSGRHGSLHGPHFLCRRPRFLAEGIPGQQHQAVCAGHADGQNDTVLKGLCTNTYHSDVAAWLDLMTMTTFQAFLLLATVFVNSATEVNSNSPGRIKRERYCWHDEMGLSV